MIDIRTLDPGFYSTISVSPALTLAMPGQDILAIIGRIPNYKYISGYSLGNVSQGYTVFSNATYYRILRVTADGSILDKDTDYNFAHVASESFQSPTSSVTLKISLFKINGMQTKIYTIPANASAVDINALSDSDIEFNVESDNIFKFKVKSDVIRVHIEDSNANQYLKIQEGGVNALWFANNYNSVAIDVLFYKSVDDYKPSLFMGVQDISSFISYLPKATDEYLWEPKIDYDSEVARAVDIAIQNGASNFLIVPVKYSDTDSADMKLYVFKQALNSIETFYPDVIVPLIPLNHIPSFAGEILKHVTEMSNMSNRAERIAILGLSDNGTLAIQDWANYASGFRIPNYDDKRIVIVYPGRCYATFDGIKYTCDGTLIAAAFAGAMFGLGDESESMTNKILTGISFDTPEASRKFKNALINSGITVCEYNNGVIRVKRALSVSQKTIAEQEISVTRTFDAIANLLRTSLENMYVGTKILPGITERQIYTSAYTILNNNFVITGKISQFNLSVEIDKYEPRRINLSVSARPVFPLIWGVINITITL